MTNPESRRVLIIKAKGGFGNRMLSAATGVVLAELSGRTPLIDWRDGMYMARGVNAYPLLFESPVNIDLEQFDDRRDVAPEIWSGRLAKHPVDVVEEFFPDKHSNAFVYRRLSVDLKDPFVPEDVAVFWSYLPKMARIRRLTQRSPRYRGLSDNQILGSVLERHFQPGPRIISEVDRLFADIPGPVIGVHVRYTDRKVPLSRIEDSLSRVRAKNPGAPIFLATDNAEVQDRIVGRFANVLTTDKVFAAGSASLHDQAVFDDPIREAENALIDMWALSRCEWLIHSRNSTFSVAAALIGGIPRARQVDVQRHDPRLIAKRWVQEWA